VCEGVSAFSKAFVDWSPDVDSLRLSTHDRDYVQMFGVRERGGKLPSASEEDEASKLLAPVDDGIRERFGVDPIVARYMLCSRAIVSGTGIVPLAEELVRRLKSADASQTTEA